MGHRIHSESETSNDSERRYSVQRKTILCLKSFGRTCIAKILTRLYAKSEKSNELSE